MTAVSDVGMYFDSGSSGFSFDSWRTLLRSARSLRGGMAVLARCAGSPVELILADLGGLVERYRQVDLMFR